MLERVRILPSPVNEHVVTEQCSNGMMPLTSALSAAAMQSEQSKKEQVTRTKLCEANSITTGWTDMHLGLHNIHAFCIGHGKRMHSSANKIQTQRDGVASGRAA